MTALLSQKSGFGAWGAPFVKFTLTYDGSLPSSGNKPKNEAKWSIRESFHPQLLDLWRSHPALNNVEQNRHFPEGGARLMQKHHDDKGPMLPTERRLQDDGPRKIFDLCEPIEKHGAWFRPLIRDSYALHCGLKILFLRKEAPGKVYQGGDIDGRIKTLLDSLTMPRHVEQVLDKSSTSFSPMHCLLEDDSMVSGLDVESERLLTAADYPVDFVRLVIEVDVRIRQATIYNQSFLG
jgi:hypothetical protein